MVKKTCSAEDIITKLREAEERASHAKTVKGNLYTLPCIRHIKNMLPRGDTVQKDCKM